MINLSTLSNDELYDLYVKTHREVNEIDPDECGKGYGARIYPIMNLIPKNKAKDIPVVEAIYCPGKDGKNAFSSLPDPQQMLAQSMVEYVATATNDMSVAASFAEQIAPVDTGESLSLTSPTDTTPTPSVTPTPSTTPTPTTSVPTPTPTPTPTPSPYSGGYY